MDAHALKEKIARAIKGEVEDSEEARRAASRDTSLFMRMPALVCHPQDAADVAAIVRIVREAGEHGDESAAIAARAAGTDMSGGPLTTGVVVSFTRHMNRVLNVAPLRHNAGLTKSDIAGYGYAEPGCYYRDFERATLEKELILPSYPASREIAALGGMVANDAGGERSLSGGKTARYVEELEVVLADGSSALFKALTPSEVAGRKRLHTLEGAIYRDMDALITHNAALIERHRPRVSKNSAGYALWAVKDGATGLFNLAKLICGSQGTLALWTRAKLALVAPKAHRAMLVVFLYDVAVLPAVVERVLPHRPESFESYDEHTFSLAVRFLPDMLAHMGWAKAARLGIEFIPELAMVATGGVPKMVLMAEFAEDTVKAADARVRAAKNALKGLAVHARIEKDERESEKFWIVRRESFNLLRRHTRGLTAAPFIDDFVVPPASYAAFLPKLDALLAEYKDCFIYTIAGHIGNGNFHIIPLMDLAKPEVRRVVLELAPKVYDLVIEHGGTTTGEHGDGIIRTPYLPRLFGPEMTALFAETKRIFDPANIFNPGKKVGGTFADIERDMI